MMLPNIAVPQSTAPGIRARSASHNADRHTGGYSPRSSSHATSIARIRTVLIVGSSHRGCAQGAGDAVVASHGMTGRTPAVVRVGSSLARRPRQRRGICLCWNACLQHCWPAWTSEHSQEFQRPSKNCLFSDVNDKGHGEGRVFETGRLRRVAACPRQVGSAARAGRRASASLVAARLHACSSSGTQVPGRMRRYWSALGERSTCS